MALVAGDKLGPYEIVVPIGKGGMGEVYRARDARLKRDVAIKVSAERFTERFENEAQAIAALNHPNICYLYDVGSDYLVMELVDGPTLADRLKEGAIPLDEALNIARQVADALEAAHEKGIVHRDLKPGNIKIKPDGTVKVLDFGLAKMGGTPTAGKAEDSPTLTMAATQAGMILGTAAYMSPEQARGKEVDKRTDIWAFGVVLYEMLTGHQLFEGETVSDVLAGVLRHEPEWEQVPVRVRRLLRKCLAKDPAKRLRDIGDAMELTDSGASSQLAVLSQGAGRELIAWRIIAAALAIVAAGLGFIAYRATRPAPLKPLVRLDVDLGSDASLGSPYGADVILSPDGTRLVYVSQNRLFTRRLDQAKANELAGTEGAYAPFFSRDGQWIAFFTNGKLKKTSVEGGAAVALCDAPSARGGSWGEDGNIIAALSNLGLSRIPEAGGTPSPVTELAPGEATHRWPQILPGNKAVLFVTNAVSANGYDTSNIEVMKLADHHRKTLVRGGTFGRYFPSSHLVYVNRGTMFAAPFDLDRLEIRGSPVPVLEQVGYSTLSGSAMFDFSDAGTLLYHSSGGAANGLRTVQWLDVANKTQPLLAKPDVYVYPRLSADGERVAFYINDVWVYEARRDTMTRLTFDGGIEPAWSPDGRYVVYSKPGDGMFWTRSDGAGKAQRLTQNKNLQHPYSFSPDGKRLAFGESSGSRGFDLWTVPIESDGSVLRAGKPEPFLQTQFSERQPAFSSDGHWLAYTSDESGINQVYVRAFPDNGSRWQISSSGAVEPHFSRKGHELFFRTEDGRMVLVANYIVKGDSFIADKPRVWSEKPLLPSGITSSYDVAPDGRRIAALMPADTPEAQQAQNHVIFLENFFDELRRRVPVTK